VALNLIEVQLLAEYIKHWQLEVWEIVFFYEIKHKNMIIKNKPLEFNMEERRL
jgi:hypothetical protein